MFENELKDAEIAKLHYKHYYKQRQKNLLRIANRVNENTLSTQRKVAINEDT